MYDFPWAELVILTVAMAVAYSSGFKKGWSAARKSPSPSTTHDWDMMKFRPGDRAPGGSDW
jgi:hypothetical protein